MQKTTKTKITKDSCKKDIKKTAELDRHLAITFFVAFGLFFALMAYLSSYMFQVSVVLGILTLVLSVLPVAYWLYKLIRSIHTLYLLSHGGFSIVTDTASYLSRGEPSRIGRHTVDAIYFTTYGRYVAEGTAFEISSNGNEFYLVILHTRKPTIALAYHTKIYQYEEQKNTDREKEYETDD